jgi:hypothetical protein
MNINQKILKNKNIIDTIKKFILNNDYNIDYKNLYPNKINWYKHNIKILEKIINEDNDKIKSIIYYKGSGYIELNKILINKAFPLIFNYKDYNQNIKNIFNKSIINTDPIYIFPSDIKKISEYKEKTILKHINNIDYIFNKYYNDIKLSECILFRGMNNISDNDINNNFSNIFRKMTQNYEYKIKNKEILNKIDEEYTFDNFVSSTFNIKTALNFINSYDKKSIGLFIILHIKKEHNIPGIYLSNIFFNNINNIANNIEEKIINKKDSESEILLNRGLTIKILKIKNISFKNKNKDKIYSIKDLYENNKKINNNINNFKKIKIIYAESCPYNLPENFTPINNFKYLCKRL